MSTVKNQWAGYRPTGRGIDFTTRSAADLASDAAFSDAIVACTIEARDRVAAARAAAALDPTPNPWDVPADEDFCTIEVEA